MNPEPSTPIDVVVIGGGPAGLMAAEVLSNAGLSVHLFDAMPSVGRKFLLAGKGGMNLTHAEPLDAFTARYAERADALGPLLQTFGPQAVRDWAAELAAGTEAADYDEWYFGSTIASLTPWVQAPAGRGRRGGRTWRPFGAGSGAHISLKNAFSTLGSLTADAEEPLAATPAEHAEVLAGPPPTPWSRRTGHRPRRSRPPSARSTCAARG